MLTLRLNTGYYIVDEQLASTSTSFFWPMGSGLGPNASML